ncbi:MAG: SMP-30/gluconolactonase/LRE family protein [Thermoleophilia bacterium]|nr:SMP-30/gluconolactonase/LRE family protein [Thermoleophilia bacterium]
MPRTLRIALATLAVLAVAAAAPAFESAEEPLPGSCATFFSDGISGRPTAILAAAHGRVWFSEPRENRLGRLDRATGETEEIRLPPGSAPRALVLAEGRLWFTSANDRVGSYEPSSGRVEILRTGIAPGSAPEEAVAPGDGHLYFTQEHAARLGRVALDTGEIRELGRGLEAGPGLHGLAAEPEGRYLWAARRDADALVRFDVTRQRFDRTVRLPRGSGPHDVVVARDGTLYVVLERSGRLAEYDPETGTLRQYRTDLPPSATPDDRPDAKLVSLALHPAGSVYATSYLHNQIYRLDPADDRLTLPVCGSPAGGGSHGISVAPDGTVWYADPIGGRVARIDEEVDRPVPPPPAVPRSPGADGP